MGAARVLETNRSEGVAKWSSLILLWIEWQLKCGHLPVVANQHEEGVGLPDDR
jgi:hypothetical protein